MTGTLGVSLCSGYGGLDLVAEKLFGGAVAVHGELSEPASRVLAAHWPHAANTGDITAADWSAWEGRIGWMTSGWPCQPWSTAGRRKGTEDERAIWPAVARAVRDLRPQVVLLENVAAIAPAGELARAVGDLAALGYVGSWRCVRASDAGAPHQRRRIFILAVDADTAGAGRRRDEPEHVGRHSGTQVRAGQAESGRRSRVAADTAGDRRDERRPQPTGIVRGPDASQCGAAVPTDTSGARLEVDRVEPARTELPATERGGSIALHAEGIGHGDRGAARGKRVQAGAVGTDPVDVDWAQYEPAIRRWESVLGRPAPEPVVVGRRGGRQLSPLFVEWLMGLPAGWVTDVEGLTRNQQLHLLGNGVVPQQGELAVRAMLPELISRERAA